MKELMLSPYETDIAKDEALFDELSVATEGMKEYYSYLTIPKARREAIIAAWQNNEDPSLLPDNDNFSVADITVKIQALKDFKSTITELTDDTTIQNLYRWKVNEMIGQLNMLLASRSGNMRHFMRWNSFVYGEPNEYAYRAALDWVSSDAEALLATNPDEDSRAAAENVLRLLEDKRGYRELLQPDSELYEQVRNDHMADNGYFAELLDGVEIPEGTITQEVGDTIVDHVIKNNLHSDYKIKKVNRTTWAVSHSNKEVEVPEKYAMSRERFIGLPLGHEVGTHLSEYVNGKNGPLLLAAIGLDRFESGSEGRALVREQVPYETFAEFSKTIRWREILRRHIAIAYAYGAGEDTPKRSSEVYQFMLAIDTLYARIDGNTDDQAKGKTTDLLLRVLKGTDGAQGVYLKDQCYLEGNISVWLTAALHGVKSISDGDKAKHDIANSRHTESLVELGVLF